MRDIDSKSHGRADPNSTGARRRYIGVHFECCGVYTRIYRRANQDAYLGRCPHCLRPVRVRVGRGGTNARIFRAS